LTLNTESTFFRERQDVIYEKNDIFEVENRGQNKVKFTGEANESIVARGWKGNL